MAFVGPEIKTGRTTRLQKQISSGLLEVIASPGSLAAQADSIVLAKDGRAVLSLRCNVPIDGRANQRDFIRNLLIENADLFNLKNAGEELNLQQIKKGAGGTHFLFNRQIAGIDVENSEVSVHLDSDDCVRLVNGYFPGVDSIKIGYRISQQEAEKIAEKAIDLKFRRLPNIVKKVICVDKGEAFSCYKVMIAARVPLGDWEVVIDGRTGKMVRCHNLLIFFSGKGSAYKTHPLAGEPEIVELPHLVAGNLCGRYADIHNDECERARSDEATYVYPTHNLHFNESNMYYLVNRVHDFYMGFGFNNFEKPMKAVVRFDVLYDNAFFSVLENAMYFGDGYKFNDLAREDSVAYHEYAHAVRHHIVRLRYEGESGAIDEGQADYFSASLSNDPIIGEYIVAKLNRPWLRNLTEKLHYPEDIAGEVHEDGKIWGCTLWDLRTALGAKVADQLIFNSLYYLHPDATFLQGLNAILTADEIGFDGKYRETIIRVFAMRGFSLEDVSAGGMAGKQLEQIRKFRALQGR
ncbi:MAG: M36 family metallopeptidase [Candidatus Riflebacteria bacterium]